MTENQKPDNTSEVLDAQQRDSNLTLRAQRFSGPLPPPDILEHYDRIVPGAAERIFSKFEQQTNHRVHMETILVWTSSAKELLGILFGFIVAVLTIAGGIYTALKGQTFLGGTLSFAGLAMIVGAFVLGKKNISDT